MNSERLGLTIVHNGEAYILAQVKIRQWLLISLKTYNRFTETRLLHTSASEVRDKTDRVKRYISGCFESNDWEIIN